MIRLIHHKKLNRQHWDEKVAAAAESNLFCYSWYLDATCSEWHALVKGEMDWIMPLPVKSRMGQHVVFQPIFTRQLGVLGATEANDTLVAEFLKAIPEKYRFRQFGMKMSETIPEGYTAEKVLHQALYLNAPADALLADLSSNARRNARKAEKAGLIFQYGGKADALVNLFQEEAGKKIKALGKKEFKRLRHLIAYMMHHQLGEMYSVLHPDSGTVAMGFFMKDGKQITYLKGAVNETGKRLGAMHFLFREVIRIYASENYRKLDFGGSKVPSVARFYRNFGAIDTFYLFLTFNRLPTYLKRIKKLRS